MPTEMTFDEAEAAGLDGTLRTEAEPAKLPTWWHQMQIDSNFKQIAEDERQREALVEWIAAIDARTAKLIAENNEHRHAIADQVTE